MTRRKNRWPPGGGPEGTGENGRKTGVPRAGPRFSKKQAMAAFLRRGPARRAFHIIHERAVIDKGIFLCFFCVFRRVFRRVLCRVFFSASRAFPRCSAPLPPRGMNAAVWPRRGIRENARGTCFRPRPLRRGAAAEDCLTYGAVIGYSQSANDTALPPGVSGPAQNPFTTGGPDEKVPRSVPRTVRML